MLSSVHKHFQMNEDLTK